ncbi:heat shock protein DnaJ domain-containing protein [Rhodopirellula maiorica SM1]|uniref:Heat shock protein DnaJ domain-containing protein n=1 Tax=Rhodopirellula maiorica SM1 TaxID=1265738 RepID=M5S2G6_9BACT|nr:J domain-containing protein [Rhodopirellula maiorica]EMI20374.1 heat shock protein DnaJ domain-containing protein [Rhodopirellula maiorica SM1]
MVGKEFADHYEVLEVSPNATIATIERVFRFLAKQHHPDLAGDRNHFAKLVTAFETLRDPQQRAAYDREYQQANQQRAELVDAANAATDDCVERYKLLSLLYAQRRRDFKKPGIGLGTLETMVPYSQQTVAFHLWYFREKGWIGREESGQLSITAAGVDQIEAMNQQAVSNHLRIEHNAERITVMKSA